MPVLDEAVVSAAHMKRPNLILIILDTVRAHNVSCYVPSGAPTPTLEAFASKGILFRNAFSNAVWTVPSHATLFTGTYPTTHGALDLHRFLDPTYATMAEILASAGYDTVGFSSNDFLSNKAFGLSRGFRLMEGPKYPRNNAERALRRLYRIATRTEDCGASSAHLFVNRWLRSRKTFAKPFFMFLNYMEAHAPYIHIPRRDLATHLSPQQRQRFPLIDQDRQKYLTRSADIEPTDFDILRSVYNAQISYLDRTINRLLDLLNREKVLDRSLVIITSDHGDMIGEHGLMHHSYCLYEELIKVPLLLKLPGREGNDSERDELVSLVDLFPTVLDVLEIDDRPFASQIQGLSLLARDILARRSYIFSECERPKNEFAETYPLFDFSVYDRQLLAIRSSRYKFIWASDGRHEFYDLVKDPGEQNNLIAVGGEVLNRLREDLLRWYDSLPKRDREATPSLAGPDLDREVTKRLRALGYF